MAYDPLSPVTRKSRVGVLAFSSASILVTAFEIRITDVPLSGIDINFAPEILSFTTNIGLAYFLMSFSIYAFDDLRNIIDPEALRIRQLKIENKKGEMIEEAVKHAISTIEEEFLVSDDKASSIEKVIRRYIERNFATNDHRIINKISIIDNMLKAMGVDTKKLPEICAFIDRVTATYALERDSMKIEGKQLQNMSRISKCVRIYLFDITFPLLTALFALLMAFTGFGIGFLRWLAGLQAASQ